MDYGTLRLGLVLVLVCYAATQLATQLQQRRIQVVCSIKVARKRLTESDGTPAMVLEHMNFFEVEIRIHRYTNKREIEPNTHPSK